LRVIADSPKTRGVESLAVIARNDSEIPVIAKRNDEAFVFDSLGLGRYRVFFDQYPQSAVDVDVTHPGETVEVRLALPPRMILAGRVVDDEGLPLPDAWVRAWPETELENPSRYIQPVLTDGEGAFSFSAFSGFYTVSVTSNRGDAQASAPAGTRNLLLRVPSYGTLSSHRDADDRTNGGLWRQLAPSLDAARTL
jgi:hypothetical protein